MSRKRVYSVSATVSGGRWLGNYVATSPEQAIEIAMKKHGCVSLCHQCAPMCEDAEITDVSAELTTAEPEEPSE